MILDFNSDHSSKNLTKVGAWSRFHYHPDNFLRMAASDKQQGMAWTRIRNFLAGYSSGVCLVLAGHPFDTIKVKVTAVWLVVLLAHMSLVFLFQPLPPLIFFLHLFTSTRFTTTCMCRTEFRSSCVSRQHTRTVGIYKRCIRTESTAV